MADQKFRVSPQLLLPWHPRYDVSISHAAELLGCSHDTVLRLIEEGALKAYRFRRESKRGWFRVYYESLVKFAEELHAESGIEPRFQRP